MTDAAFSRLEDRPEFAPVIARWWFDEWGHESPGLTYQATLARVQASLDEVLPVTVIAVDGDTPLGVAEHPMSFMKPSRRSRRGSGACSSHPPRAVVGSRPNLFERSNASPPAQASAGSISIRNDWMAGSTRASAGGHLLGTKGALGGAW